MNCKYCGAPVDAGATRCPYCGNDTPYAQDSLEQRQREERLAKLGTLKHTSGFFMIILYCLTLGLYAPLWYTLRAPSLNRLTPDQKLPLAAVWFNLLLGFCVIFTGKVEELFLLAGIEYEYQSIFNTAFTLYLILSTWLAFKTRRILWRYATQHIEKSVVLAAIAPSSTLLFLTGTLYLQCSINKMLTLDLLTPDI